MPTVDFANPRDVCKRLAALHLEGVRRQQTLEALQEAQGEDDRERDRLGRLLLAMAADGTAVQVEVPNPDGFAFANRVVALVVDNRLITCHELKASHELPELLADEISAALGGRAAPDGCDPRIAFEAAPMAADDDVNKPLADPWSSRTMDGKLRLPAGVFVP
jgi:hypothetical protein